MAYKAITYIRSYQNYCIRSCFYNFNKPLNCTHLILMIHSHEFKRQQTFATLQVRSSNEIINSIEISYIKAGRIYRMNEDWSANSCNNEYRLQIRQNEKNRKQLLEILQCDHQPSQQEENTCRYCNDNYDYYYNLEEKIITLKDLKQYCNDMHSKDQFFQWKVILNEDILYHTTICLYNDQSFELKVRSKISYINFFPNINLLSNNDVLLKYREVICAHDKVYKHNSCCLYCLDKVNIQFLKTPYLFSFGLPGFNSTIIYSERIMKIAQSKWVDSIVNNNKLVLILDLDNTILHTQYLSKLQPQSLSDLNSYYKLKIPSHNAQGYEYQIVKMRLFFKQFLMCISQLYEIIIYTKGSNWYANAICQSIRWQYGGQIKTLNENTQQQRYNILNESDNFKQGRLIARQQDPDLQSKSYKKVFPTCKNCFLIMDDRKSIWGNSACIEVQPFFYSFKFKRNQLLVSSQVSCNQRDSQFNEFKDIENNNSNHLQITTVSQQSLLLNGNQILNSEGQNTLVQISSKQKQIEIRMSAQNQGQLKQEQNEIKRKHKQIDNIVKIQMENNLSRNFYYHYKDIQNDYCLIYYSYILRQCHQRYYENKNKQISLFQVYLKFKKSLLKGYRVKLLTDENMFQKTHIKQYCKKIGLYLIQGKSQEIPHLIIRDNGICNQKSISLLKYYAHTFHVPVVSDIWILSTYIYGYAFDYRMFQFESPLQQKYFDMNQTAKEIGEILRSNILNEWNQKQQTKPKQHLSHHIQPNQTQNNKQSKLTQGHTQLKIFLKQEQSQEKVKQVDSMGNT